MNDQLNYAPCGYLTMTKQGIVTSINHTLLQMLNLEVEHVKGRHFNTILTAPSRIYFQTYFPPLLTEYKKVNEMYITIKSENDKIPVLLNAVERNINNSIQIECVLIPMQGRDEYENELITDKRKTEKILLETDAAYMKLKELMLQVEEKQEQLLELNRQLQMLATTDTLTGLKNRRFLQEKLLDLLNETQINDYPFSLLLLDVDHFKKVNDTYGHPTGDAVLQELSMKLLQETSDQDIVARMGGEEFIILLPHTDSQTALLTAERIREFIAESTWNSIQITISIGVTTYIHGDNLESLLSNADEALYASKKEGRNRVTVMNFLPVK